MVQFWATLTKMVNLTFLGSSLIIIKTAMKRPTNKELDILRLLASHADGLYGLQLVELSDGQIKRGSVYVYLSRLKGDNLVSARTIPAPEGYGGLPRPTYKITGYGQRILDAESAYDLHFAGVPS